MDQKQNHQNHQIDINTRLNNSNTKCAFHTIKLENE
jgi:hypothetical protein